MKPLRLAFLAFAFVLTHPTLAYEKLTGAMWTDFRDAAQSTVDYTATPFRPALACSQLQERTDYNVSVVAAQLVPAADAVPEHCQVDGVIQPEIRFRVNLPTRWNGRLYMMGNGGYAGQQADSWLHRSRHQNGLAHGFVTVSTDTGHDEAVWPLATFAYNNYQKEIDYFYRSIHLTALTAKEIAGVFYGQTPSRSYFSGCSTGGRQGLMSAQRFPNDFDGIVAGAPVLDFTGTHLWFAWAYGASEKAPYDADKVARIAGSLVNEQCDALDGLKDGLIHDPQSCPFDPAKDLPRCGAGRGASADCFNEAELETIQKIYSGVISHGRVVYPGFPPGSEGVGRKWALPGNPQERAFSAWEQYLSKYPDGQPVPYFRFLDSFFKYVAFEKDDPNYDWRSFDFDRDMEKLDHLRNGVLDASVPDMSRFRKRGGKIIQYHGWADDGGLNPGMSINYYESVADFMGEASTRDFFQLYMVPGMFHCWGGFGPDTFDAATALIDWVEAGKPPVYLHAEEFKAGKLARSRPLCPYPQTAKYNRSKDDPNDARNFTCQDANDGLHSGSGNSVQK